MCGFSTLALVDHVEVVSIFPLFDDRLVCEALHAEEGIDQHLFLLARQSARATPNTSEMDVRVAHDSCRLFLMIHTKQVETPSGVIHPKSTRGCMKSGARVGESSLGIQLWL